VALAVALACAACAGDRTLPGDVSDSTFVAAMADLRRAVQPGAAETMRDSAGRQAIRDSILRHYHVTAAALESTASHLADHQGHADEIMRAIDRKAQAPLPRPIQPPAAPAPAAPPAQAISPPAAPGRPATGSAPPR